MKALVIIDVQNEFSPTGKRPVPQFTKYLGNIHSRVSVARQKEIPIAWVKHYNLPHESAAFIPGEWGSEFAGEMGPLAGSEKEVLFEKNVYGAFTGSAIGSWLQSIGADSILIMGFYTHGCVSTTAREAIMAGLNVYLDPETTGTCAIHNDLLGEISADDSKRAALLQLYNMGAKILTTDL